ncbi:MULTISPECIES: SDR family NAD(P)-dependent oxidoreductase [Micrococcales]|uniref:NAD(P)-dependent dehydrogenase (Short-subunit alcohol dehydrogenase family) n=2 Tax=Micrococcales TaxID=85006 RepID=A0AAW8NDX8_PSEOX|nr:MULTISPECIES: SDR family NAD(P)-dependent oxidoreductase [Micrococcales]MDJ1370232.1 short-chain dehydrogenase [Gulosibacter molinativorax]MDR7165736.1 NAD(P)-dependent dehydrogenase (short-subunit alcohol dehydrogenase family) [Pseudarthrobacter oxydans]QUY61646.1 Putative ketoacyl reductase [Gulosibacter molinativorax]
MSTIAIVGAGRGLGLSIAKVFGRNGFDVALISLFPDELDELVLTLKEEGITSAGFPADVTDRDQLVMALEAAKERFGRIDVLEYSPYAGLDISDPTQLTVDAARGHIETILYGAIAAVETVLPEMRASGSGTLLFTTGGGAINPYPFLASTNIAQAGLRNWVYNLHQVLAEHGVHVGNVAINVAIGDHHPDDVPHAHPDQIAPLYWEHHTTRTAPEALFPAQRA